MEDIVNLTIRMGKYEDSVTCVMFLDEIDTAHEIRKVLEEFRINGKTEWVMDDIFDELDARRVIKLAAIDNIENVNIDI